MSDLIDSSPQKTNDRLHAPVAISPADIQASTLLEPRPQKPESITLSRAMLEAGLHTKTCLQCGLNPAESDGVERKFQYVPPWVYFGLLLNIIVLLVLYFIGRKRVTTRIPLCSTCDAADKRGRTMRGLSFGGLIVGPLLGLLAGAPFDGSVTLATSAVGLVAGIVGMIVTHRRTRDDVIACTFLDKAIVRLRASATWRRVLVDEGVSGALAE